MAITLFHVDKSGSEILEKDYSITVIKNKEIVYGINVPQSLKDQVMHLFNTNQLKIISTTRKKERLRLKIRFHIAIIISLIEKAIKDGSKVTDLDIQICNDIDGHFHEIKGMIYSHISKLVPSMKKEDIVQTKFSKTSLVHTSAKNFRENKKEEIKNYSILKIDKEKLINLIKK